MGSVQPIALRVAPQCCDGNCRRVRFREQSRLAIDSEKKVRHAVLSREDFVKLPEETRIAAALHDMNLHAK